MNGLSSGAARPLPLVLLTGFLGSGKTSTLRHWLATTDRPLEHVAVLINDFGEVNVDAALLARRALAIRQITGGCVCCQSDQEMIEQVAFLADDPQIDLAWIETSGLADPEEVLDNLSAPELLGRAFVAKTVLVVDSSDFPCSWRGLARQREQLHYADLIILNKADRLATAALAKVAATVRQASPHAEILTVTRGQVPADVLTPRTIFSATTHHHEPAPGAEPSLVENDSNRADGGLGDSDYAHAYALGREAHPHPAKQTRGHSAATLFLPLPGAIDRPAFTRFIAELPRSVFRAKGFVRFHPQPEQVFTFQQVRDQSELLLLPLEDAAGLATGLVLIGPALPEDELRRQAGALVEATALP